MVRKHGWELPAHTFQVVAITVFCLLVVAFYAFYAPFIGGRSWEYALIAIYSPVAFLVFVLYVRCTAINPADPGTTVSNFHLEEERITQNPEKSLSAKEELQLPIKYDDCEEVRNIGSHSAPTSSSSSIIAVNMNSGKKSSSYCDVGGILCGLFVHEDCRRKEEGMTGEDDALFCSLCNAEVHKFSKHCRNCDKCVEGFDHHCQWLNNCVGRKNYASFLSLMAISLIWLVIEVGVGIGVLVRCIVNKKSMESEIIDRLGNGFSRAPFAAVVAVCTLVSMLACLPLAELFFFHIILIRKGITTYEYVVAMRAMSEAPIEEELPNVLYSPTGSATTGYSGGSSTGLQYKGAWCTPPRVFVDYQEEVAPQLEPGMVPSTIDPDVVRFSDRLKTGSSKRPPVRINPWKLAKLDSNEAMKMAAEARASSSILRPLQNHRHLAGPSSSGTTSLRSNSLSTDTVGPANKSEPPFAPSYQGSLDEYESGTQTASSFSSPNHVKESVTLCPLPQAYSSTIQHINTKNNNNSVAVSLPGIFHNGSKAPLKSTSNHHVISHTSSSGFDEKVVQSGAGPTSFLLRDIKRTAVVWDQEAGRFVSVPVSASETRNRPILHVPNVGPSDPEKQAGAATANKPPTRPLGQQQLTYSEGDSIFFSGPVFGGPIKDGLIRGLDSRVPPRISSVAPRYKRDSARGMNQLPVFVPGGLEQNHDPSGSGL